VNVVGHQAVGVYLATEFQRLPLKLFEVVKIIVLAKKAV
jgi:hypothetical protein